MMSSEEKLYFMYTFLASCEILNGNRLEMFVTLYYFACAVNVRLKVKFLHLKCKNFQSLKPGLNLYQTVGSFVAF